MDHELRGLVMELGRWPRNGTEANRLLEGSGWFYMPKTGAVKNNATRRVVHKPEWQEERRRLEAAVAPRA